MDTKKQRVVFLDSGGLRDRLNTSAMGEDVLWQNHDNSTADEAIKRAHNADVLVVNKVKIDERLLLACPTVKHIAVAATGYNIVDVSACARHGVSVSNIPSYSGVSVAEHVISMALSLRRELIQYREQVINLRWNTSPDFCLYDRPISNLNGCVFGVIGFGNLGQATGRLAAALGMQVIYNSRTQRNNDFASYVEFDELIRQSDIVSLHCSLTAQTENLISLAELGAMKDSAILINTARGGIANEQAVVDAVKSGTISGVGFDVLKEEPPVNGSPLINIAAQSNVILTPHIAWASESSIAELCSVLVNNVKAFINNRPTNLVG